jgi:hypothetical protein
MGGESSKATTSKGAAKQPSENFPSSQTLKQVEKIKKGYPLEAVCDQDLYKVLDECKFLGQIPFFDPEHVNNVRSVCNNPPSGSKFNEWNQKPWECSRFRRDEEKTWHNVLDNNRQILKLPQVQTFLTTMKSEQDKIATAYLNVPRERQGDFNKIAEFIAKMSISPTDFRIPYTLSIPRASGGHEDTPLSYEWVSPKDLAALYKEMQLVLNAMKKSHVAKQQSGR